VASEEDIRAFLSEADKRGWSKSTLGAVAESVLYGEGKGPSSLMQGEMRVKQERLGSLTTRNIRRAMVELCDLMTEVASERPSVQEYILGYQPAGEEISSAEKAEMAKWNGYFRRALHISSGEHGEDKDWVGKEGVAGVIRSLVEEVAVFVAARREMQAILAEGRSYQPSELDEVVETAVYEPAV
jgi:hypothetical protein